MQTRYYGLLGKIVFDNNCIVLPGLFSHADGAVAAVWSGCDLRVLCQQSGTAVSSYQAPPLLSTLGLARVCRPAADIADPEPGTEDGEWRLLALTLLQSRPWGHSLPGFWTS